MQLEGGFGGDAAENPDESKIDKTVEELYLNAIMLFLIIEEGLDA
jgi:hypothetical protein